uniref:Transcription initiation factor IIF subunit beta n=1 Tax=Elaeis guineensis var. tenera TaxID=51953 RepID=A0A6I9QMG9_ELAGV|nr:transcription initiation factor IIF subunit beta [Elaeis guineensis]
MEPHSENFGEYGKLCRERTNKAMIKTRQVQVIDNDHGVLMRPMPGMVGLVPSGSKDKKRVTPTKGSDVKRTRRDRRELENIIFKLFERQPNWALKQLVQETDQPEVFSAQWSIFLYKEDESLLAEFLYIKYNWAVFGFTL